MTLIFIRAGRSCHPADDLAHILDGPSLHGQTCDKDESRLTAQAKMAALVMHLLHDEKSAPAHAQSIEV